ncbi:MAG: phage virion morphogenesis protein, partial [Aeromonas sp.]
QLAATMARTLRDSQARRVRSNTKPDGSAMAPRKPQPSLKKGRGRLRKKMFLKLTTRRWLKSKGTPSEALVEFVGSARRLAPIHHYGLKDRIKGREISYPARELLGITEQDCDKLETILLEHFAHEP